MTLMLTERKKMLMFGSVMQSCVIGDHCLKERTLWYGKETTCSECRIDGHDRYETGKLGLTRLLF